MDMNYIRDLHNADDKVQSVSPQIHKNNRPFVGVVVICEKHKYCIPLDHPKEKHYTMKNDSPPEKAYKILCSKELDWIQKNQDSIIKKANKLYRMASSGNINHNLRKRCLNFKKLEAVLEKRLTKTHSSS